MLMHLVCFKYRPGTDRDTRTQHCERLRALCELEDQRREHRRRDGVGQQARGTREGRARQARQVD